MIDEQVGKEPNFQAIIIKTDLVQMIMDALRFRVKWHDIESGQFFYSPALKRIAKSWYERVGLRYQNPNMEEMNRKVTQVKMNKADKKGRSRRDALKPTSYFPTQELEKFIATRKTAADYVDEEVNEL